MNKNYYQLNDEREDWAKKTAKADDSLVGEDIKEELFKKLSRLNIELKGKRIVQLGCLKGYLMKSLLEKGAYVHAVDFSQTMLEVTRSNLPKFPNEAERYQLSPIIRDFSILTDFSFDLVIAVTMLGYVPENMTKRIIEDAKRVLKEKGGLLVFRLPLDNKHTTVKGGMHPHLDINFWTRKELAKIAQEYKYHAVDIDRVSIFYKSKP